MSIKKKVLTIDDNQMQLDMFKKMLEVKYDIRTASSATNAISFLNTYQVDLVLLDIEMPNISGFEFLYDIRRIPSYTDVPIIIVSGNTGTEFYNQARNSSAFDVLSKPVTHDLLVKTIEQAFAAIV